MKIQLDAILVPLRASFDTLLAHADAFLPADIDHALSARDQLEAAAELGDLGNMLLILDHLLDSRFPGVVKRAEDARMILLSL